MERGTIEQYQSKDKVVAILSGGNVDMYLLGQVVAKGLMQMGRLLKIFILLPDKPGALKRVVDGIAELSVNIVEVEHDRLSAHIPAGTAGVYLSLELENEKHAQRLITVSKKRRNRVQGGEQSAHEVVSSQTCFVSSLAT